MEIDGSSMTAMRNKANAARDRGSWRRSRGKLGRMASFKRASADDGEQREDEQASVGGKAPTDRRYLLCLLSLRLDLNPQDRIGHEAAAESDAEIVALEAAECIGAADLDLGHGIGLAQE
jgi:hypothetical protein